MPESFNHLPINQRRKAWIQRLRKQLRSAASPNELHGLFPELKQLYGGSRTSGWAPSKQGMTVFARNVASEALDQGMIAHLVDNGVAHILIERAAPTEDRVLELLLKVCVGRLLGWDGVGKRNNTELPIIDSLLCRGLELPEGTREGCERLLRNGLGEYTNTKLFSVSELLLRIPSGVNSELLGRGLTFSLHLPYLVLRCMRHPSWSRETWLVRQNKRRLLHHWSDEIWTGYLARLEPREFRDQLFELATSEEDQEWKAGKVLSDGKLPGLAAITVDDCIMLLQAPHSEVRLGAQLHISRLAASQAAMQDEVAPPAEQPAASGRPPSVCSRRQPRSRRCAGRLPSRAGSQGRWCRRALRSLRRSSALSGRSGRVTQRMRYEQ